MPSNESADTVGAHILAKDFEVMPVEPTTEPYARGSSDSSHWFRGNSSVWLAFTVRTIRGTRCSAALTTASPTPEI